MRAVLKTNDPVELSLATALLKDAGIGHVVLDGNISILEGSIGIFPRRLMVLDEDYRNARGLLQAAEILDSVTDDLSPERS